MCTMYYVFQNLWTPCIFICTYDAFHLIHFHNCTHDVVQYQYIWCISISVHMMYFYISTYDVFLYLYIWCISISDWEWRATGIEWEGILYFYIYTYIYIGFYFYISNWEWRALSGRALDLDWSFRLFPPALLSHNHFLDRRYRYIGLCGIFSFISLCWFFPAFPENIFPSAFLSLNHFFVDNKILLVRVKDCFKWVAKWNNGS